MILKLFNHFRLGVVLFIFLLAGYYDFSDSFPIQTNRCCPSGKIAPSSLSGAESRVAVKSNKLTVKRCQQ